MDNERLSVEFSSEPGAVRVITPSNRKSSNRVGSKTQFSRGREQPSVVSRVGSRRFAGKAARRLVLKVTQRLIEGRFGRSGANRGQMLNLVGVGDLG